MLRHYCRDFANLAIIHSSGTASVIQHIGDRVPQKRQEIDSQYPIFNKVRYSCKKHDPATATYLSSPCEKEEVSTILWPLHRRRHFFRPASIPGIDTVWNMKKSKAVWRGDAHLTPEWRYKEDMLLNDTVAMR